MVIKTHKLSQEIMRNLEVYTTEIKEQMDVVGENVVTRAVKTLQQTSPKLTGEYAKNWTYKVLRLVNAPARFTIHNVDTYRLAHLLEKGHAKEGGGRTDPQVHIQPVDDMVVEEYIKGVEEAITSGSGVN